jgi:hypothetical protein
MGTQAPLQKRQHVTTTLRQIPAMSIMLAQLHQVKLS